jgi:hypothetical protein
MFHRSLFSAVFIPHEYCTPRNTVHPSTWGGCRGGLPPLQGPGGSCPLVGVRGTTFPDGVLGENPMKEKLPCKCIL